jgi:two-component system, OmpR family, sensor kinase
MLKTIYGKITAILLCLFLLIGLLYVFITFFVTKLYIQEVDQRLYHSLAEYLVSKNTYMKEGKINENALEESFKMLMHINPTIELYLLDAQGKILSFSAPAEKIKRKQVSLEPLKNFLGERTSLPILGDDPRDPDRKKVFSVSPLPLKGPVEGYLYIILGGESYDSIAQILQKSYILRLSIWIAIAGLLFVFLTGLLLFSFLTRRLRKLTTAVESFKESNFNEPAALSGFFDKHPGDEIDRLGMAFSQMSDRIIEQLNKIKEVDSLRRELVSNVSHDLRTPLTSLHGYLETLSIKGDSLSPQEQKKYLTIAIKHSERLRKLIAELFELAKLDSQEVKLTCEPCHLGELLQDILQKNQITAEKQKINFQTELPENLPFVFIDIGLIERAIQNLIDNSLRYTREGGTVTISLLPEESRITAKFSDNGYGISEEDLPYIFDRYYRAKKDDSASAGLGLAITKRILELHGSGIKVQSELNVGTTFIFSLPLCSKDSYQDKESL